MKTEELPLLQKLIEKNKKEVPNPQSALGDTIVCDELVKAIEGVTTNGKTKLQQG